MAPVATPLLDASKTKKGMAPVATPLMDAPDLPRGYSMMNAQDRKKLMEQLNPAQDLRDFTTKSQDQSRADSLKRKSVADLLKESAILITGPVENNARPPQLPQPRGINRFPNDSVDGSGRFIHEWKIVSGQVDQQTEFMWNVSGGKIYYLNDATEATVPDTQVEGETGTIYLHVERNPSSRAVTGQTIEFHQETPLTGESDQYFELGRVGGTPRIFQKRFSPIHVFEDLFVINGEFKLGNISMLADSLYGPPA